MKLKIVAEVIERFYNVGRVKASNLTLEKRDFLQYAKMSFANRMRNLYYQLKAGGQGEEYYFFSGDILSEKFTLSKPDNYGKSRIDMTDKPVIRMPKNAHILNIIPVEDGCSFPEPLEITQVQPGEERFYLGPDFNSFTFFVSKGTGLDVYRMPDCVKEVEVEAIYDKDDMDIPLDMAFDICNDVLGISLKVKGFPIPATDNPYDPNAIELRRQLQTDKPIQ